MDRAYSLRIGSIRSNTEQDMILLFLIPAALGLVSLYYTLKVCFYLGERNHESNNIGDNTDGV